MILFHCCKCGREVDSFSVEFNANSGLVQVSENVMENRNFGPPTVEWGAVCHGQRTTGQMLRSYFDQLRREGYGVARIEVFSPPDEIVQMSYGAPA